MGKLEKDMMLTYSQLGKMGRFGNQLFQIASTIGIANTLGYSYAFPKWEYQSYFTNPIPTIIDCNKAVSFIGYLQNYELFLDSEKSIRQYFTFKNEKEKTNKIFIHFRAYKKEGVTRFHPEMSTEYYTEAVKHFPNKEFIVFTDDITSAKKVIKLDCEFCCGNEIEDFKKMVSCEGGIICNSSYSWWAAWLGNGKVTIPNKWFSRIAPYKSDGYYVPNWIKI